MNELIRAALGEGSNRFLLIDTPITTVQSLVRRQETTLVVFTSVRSKVLSKAREQLGSDGKVILLSADRERAPFSAPGFDVVIIDADQHRWEEPVEQLRVLRALTRPNGALMVFNRLREGPIGGVTSAAQRIFRGQVLPKASDLTKWMLLAGLRKVRQANVPKAVVPTVMTWADVRARPWEEVVSEPDQETDISASQP